MVCRQTSWLYVAHCHLTFDKICFSYFPNSTTNLTAEISTHELWTSLVLIHVKKSVKVISANQLCFLVHLFKCCWYVLALFCFRFECQWCIAANYMYIQILHKYEKLNSVWNHFVMGTWKVWKHREMTMVGQSSAALSGNINQWHNGIKMLRWSPKDVSLSSTKTELQLHYIV